MALGAAAAPGLYRSLQQLDTAIAEEEEREEVAGPDPALLGLHGALETQRGGTADHRM